MGRGQPFDLVPASDLLPELWVPTFSDNYADNLCLATTGLNVDGGLLPAVALGTGVASEFDPFGSIGSLQQTPYPRPDGITSLPTNSAARYSEEGEPWNSQRAAGLPNGQRYPSTAPIWFG